MGTSGSCCEHDDEHLRSDASMDFLDRPNNCQLLNKICDRFIWLVSLLGGLVVIVFAIGPKVCEFKAGRGR